MRSDDTVEAAGKVLLPGGAPLNVRVAFRNGSGGMMTAEQLEECAARVAELALSKIQERGLSAGMPAEPESLPWVPMVKGVQNRERCEELARRNGIPLETLLGIETWLNDRYQCSVRRCRPNPDRPDMIHLSIRRHDRAACHDWRDFQRIKNDVIGAEHEAVELYPADSRLVDSANQYHSWVLADKTVRFPMELEEAMKPGPKRKPLAQRLWEKVDLTAGPDKCWLFGGTSDNGNGYATISRPGDSTGQTPMYVHRLAYALANGVEYDDLPKDEEVRHTCHTKKCCNPAHLLLGTSVENKADSIAVRAMFWQRAKRDAAGKFLPEGEPSEDDRRHLWALAEAGVPFPLGFVERDVTHPAEGTLHKQRPWASGEQPEQTEAKTFTRTM